MFLGPSSSSNQSLPSFPSLPFGVSCLITEPYSLMLTIYTITNILLLLPLCILVLYHGLRRQQQRRSSPVSHSDVFTCHLVTMEMVFVSGCVACCYGSYRLDSLLLLLGFYMFSFNWYGETFFHALTCVEHYLAVVHPITYMSLKEEKWIRIRNIVVGCVWLLCIVGSSLSTVADMALLLLFCIMPLSLFVVSFCCLSVLRALLRPRPGDQSRADQAKRRAFYTIVSILAVLLMRCALNVVWMIVHELNLDTCDCIVIISDVWFTLPSSLMLPLLFLQKTGTIRCFKIKNKDERN